jgi:mannose-6-phosphate isomerase-like protein (cupin superfamily)
MSLLEFFLTEDDDQANAPVVYKSDEIQLIDAKSGIEWKLYGKNFAKRKMAFMQETYPPGADTGEESFAHEGEEAGCIISGKLELTVDGDVYELAVGDGYYFETTRPHRFRNPYEEPCILVSSLTPPKL